MRSYYLLILLSFLIVSCQSGGNSSQNYPARPITYLVPWKAGGGTDISSRAMAAVLQKKLETPVNVVNRTGGGGVVGHLALSQARPDGYTLGAITVEICMMHNMGLTPLTYKEYTPLALLTNNAASVTVRVDAPWETVQDLLDDIKKYPGKFKASGTSRGGIWDLARIGFLQTAGLEESALPWVPSQGANPALQELLAGGVDVVTAALAEVNALRQSGQVKTLAVMADERLPSFPDVPTLKELGIDWSLGGWVGLAAPAKLDSEVYSKLNSAVGEAVKDSSFVNALTRSGFYIQYMSGEQFSQFVAEQDKLFGDLMVKAGIIEQNSGN